MSITNSLPQQSSEREAPWLARADWAAGQISSSKKFAMIFFWLAALIWNLAVFAFLRANIVAQSEHDSKLGMGALLPIAFFFIALFQVGGIFLVWAAIQGTLRWRRYGKVVFQMASVPGVIGGALEGQLRLGVMVQPIGNYLIKLRCIQQPTNKAAGVLWEATHEAPGEMTDVLPVLFAIPSDCPETSNDDPRVVWQLEATAQVPGLKLFEQIAVPVFKVTPTTAQAAAAERAHAAERAARADYKQPFDSPFRMQTSARGGKEFIFPAGRGRSPALAVELFIILWGGLIEWVGHLLAPPLFILIVASLIEVPALWILINLLFRRTRVTIEDGTITVTGNLLGSGWTRSCATSEVERIQTKPGINVGIFSTWNIKIILRNQSTITAASNLKDHQEADWLATEMSKAAGLKN